MEDRAEVDGATPGGDYRGQGGMQGPSRMQSPSRLGATKKIPATAHRMERQMPIPATPMNVTFNLPQGATTGRKYTYADLTPPSPGAQSYSDATNSGEWVAQAGAVIPCRMTPVNPPMNDSYYCQHLRPSPKQNLFGQAGGSSSPMNDSYYCQPLPQTPAINQRTATGRKSSARQPRPRSALRCGPSCNRR
ncbi:hypothetical protein J437_LFUL007232 [Ladona fulva]|uniref:Uncharacterized protein n=1 Tax=Ladona fulva TaxID=123851 RepID=A0A8K0K4A1_LADFU|nr:hypothetical protein J437_LFUL007232 [Ladona fulva]